MLTFLGVFFLLKYGFSCGSPNHNGAVVAFEKAREHDGPHRCAPMAIARPFPSGRTVNTKPPLVAMTFQY